MTGNKRIHPINIVKWLAVLLSIATWGLGLAGFALGDSRWYRWAGFTLAALLCVAFSPIIAFAIGSIVERRNR
jgi:hypothetical protein